MRKKIKVQDAANLQDALNITPKQLTKYIASFKDLIQKSVLIDGKGRISTAIGLTWNNEKVSDKELIVHLINLGDMLHGIRTQTMKSPTPGYT